MHNQRGLHGVDSVLHVDGVLAIHGVHDLHGEWRAYRLTTWRGVHLVLNRIKAVNFALVSRVCVLSLCPVLSLARSGRCPCVSPFPLPPLS